MDQLEALYIEIEGLIEERLGEKGKPFTVGKFSGLGWLDFHYRCSTYEGLYPRISLKRQANAVHVYVMHVAYGLLKDYVDIFGKTGIGKGCIRIKKLTPERHDALLEIVDKVWEGHGNAGK